jgi:hypothetical protein
MSIHQVPKVDIRIEMEKRAERRQNWPDGWLLRFVFSASPRSHNIQKKGARHSSPKLPRHSAPCMGRRAGSASCSKRGSSSRRGISSRGRAHRERVGDGASGSAPGSARSDHQVASGWPRRAGVAGIAIVAASAGDERKLVSLPSPRRIKYCRRCIGGQ